MHEGADALLRSATNGQDKGSLEDDLPLYAIDSLDDPHAPVHTVEQDGDHARNVPKTNPTDDEADFDPPTTVKIVRTQQQDFVCRAAAIPVRQRSCEFTVNKESKLFLKAHIDGAIQVMLAPSLWQRVPIILHYLPIAGHPG